MEYGLEEIKTNSKYYKIYKEDYTKNNQKRLFGVCKTEKTAKTVLYYLYDNTDFIVEMHHSPVNLAEIKATERTKEVIFETEELEHQIRYRLHINRLNRADQNCPTL